MTSPGRLFDSAWILLVSLFFLVTTTAHAETVKLTVNKQVVVIGDSVVLEVHLPSGDAQVLSFSGNRQMELQTAGTENSMSIVNGKMSSKNVQKYQFTPREIGEFIIGPAKVRHDKKELLTNQVKVLVQGAGSERYLTVDAKTRPGRVYVGQLFSVKIEAVYGASLKATGWNPANAAVLVDVLGQNKSPQSQSTVKRDGQTFQQLKLTRWMYAKSPGPVKLAGGQLTFEMPSSRRSQRGFPFNGFGFGPQGQRKNMGVPAQNIGVTPLPAPPANMTFLGVVGSMEARWSGIDQRSNQLKGVLEIVGNGAAPALDLEAWVADGWRVYPDKPESTYKLTTNGQVVVIVKIPVTIIAADDRSTAIPAWFDPNEKKYKPLPLPLNARAVRHVKQQHMDEGDGEQAYQADRRKIAVSSEPAWVTLASTQVANGAAASSVLLLIVLSLMKSGLGRKKRPHTLISILDQAILGDDIEAWQQAYVLLNQIADPVPGLEDLKELIGTAIYSPRFISPVTQVQSWKKEYS